MAINESINYPLLNELYNMGVLSAKTSPKQVGPFQTNAEAFTGDTSGSTKTLAETPLSGGVMVAMTIATAHGTANSMSVLTEDTHFSIDGDEMTYLSDQSANSVFMLYAI